MHPADQTVAARIRDQRASSTLYPSRTRPLGAHSLRQCSVGRLVVETARADVGVDGESARRRREAIAAEFERRDMHAAAEEARRRADEDRRRTDEERRRAERERYDVDRGPSPSERLLGAAMTAAAATSVVTAWQHGHDAETITSDIRAQHPVTGGQDVALDGSPVTGLTRAEMNAEVSATGGRIADTPAIGPESPAHLVGQSTGASTATDVQVPSSPRPSPEITPG